MICGSIRHLYAKGRHYCRWADETCGETHCGLSSPRYVIHVRFAVAAAEMRCWILPISAIEAPPTPSVGV